MDTGRYRLQQSDQGEVVETAGPQLDSLPRHGTMAVDNQREASYSLRWGMGIGEQYVLLLDYHIRTPTVRIFSLS